MKVGSISILAVTERHLLRILPDEDMSVTEMDAPAKADKVKPPKKKSPPGRNHLSSVDSIKMERFILISWTIGQKPF
jgi:hypothetical protein